MGLFSSLTGGDVVGAGLSVLNNLFGVASQDSAQDFNAREAEKNRQFQAKQLDSQYFYNSQLNKQSQEWQSNQNQIARDWEEQMYNLYNSPSAMMAQYKKAGLNPYLGASGQTGAGIGTSAPLSGSPALQGVGLPTGSQASAPGVFRPSLAADYASIAGVNAQAANQNAQTTALNWKTYEDIYYHVGKDAAKHFLSGHPEMFQSDDPENAPYMQAYRRSAIRENLENSILSTRDWLQDRYGYQNAEKSLLKADAEIDNLTASASKSRSAVRRVASEIAKNFADAYKLQQEGNKYKVDAETANRIMDSVVAMYLSKSSILSMLNTTTFAQFDSMREVREWLTSPEGHKTMYENFEEKQDLMPLTILLESLGTLFHVNGNIGFSSSDVNVSRE